MVAQPGDLKSSCNAGEFSEELKGKISLKQYYSAALRMKNVEPVPQSGFRLMPATALVDTARSATARHATLRVTPSLSYTLVFTPGFVDIYRNDRTKVHSKAIAAITAAILPELEFYGEANTFGIFHPELRSQRLFRNPSDDTAWTLDDWPYESLPEVDLGGTYPKTTDIWDVFLRWQDNIQVFMQFTVDGELTPSIPFQNTAGDPVGAGTPPDWAATAAAIQAAINDLPSVPGGVVVSGASGGESAWRFTIEFAGASDGAEYQLSALITNTSQASALATHRQIGKTDGEPLVSNAQGWFAGMDLYQDRAVYFGPKARPAATAMSQTAEYFNLNIESQAQTAARLEALRTETSEAVLAVYESKYLLVFTDQAEWFATNRTIVQGEPVNFVRASKNGLTPHVPVVEMEGRVYYVSGSALADVDDDQGQTLYSAGYDDVTTSYNSEPESLLASHLIEGIDGACLQSKVKKNDAARWWLKRRDGRLICALVIRNQEIMALCEWVAAAAGKVRAISRDGQNQVWLTIERGGILTTEIMEEQERNLFQGAIRGATDLAGRFEGLDIWEGKTVWARADGYILGPYTVAGGAIDLEDPYTDVCAGLWQPPMHESMPYVKVLPNDTILRRPGRIHSAEVYVIDTESIAIGANGGQPKNIPLLTANDPTDAPMPPKKQYVRATGMPGMVADPTLVITQTRPGMLRVRDYTPEAVL